MSSLEDTPKPYHTLCTQVCLAAATSLEEILNPYHTLCTQVCLSAASLFHRVRGCSHVPRAEHSNPLVQLEAVGNFVGDMQAALRELRGAPHQAPVPHPAGPPPNPSSALHPPAAPVHLAAPASLGQSAVVGA